MAWCGASDDANADDGRMGQSALKEVKGTVEKVGFMEIELEIDGREVEVHGPSWFWHKIGIKEGDEVTVKGVLVSIMELGEGWQKELLPFELTANNETYGNASKKIPVWMQV